MKALDAVFNDGLVISDDDVEEYITFWDKDGVMENGLWVILKDESIWDEDIAGGHNKLAVTAQSSRVRLEILPNEVAGDMLLAIDKKCKGRFPSPKHLIGIAIIAKTEPKEYGKYITNYFRKIHEMVKAKRFGKYQTNLYVYLLKALGNCNLRVVTGMTMKGLD